MFAVFLSSSKLTQKELHGSDYFFIMYDCLAQKRNALLVLDLFFTAIFSTGPYPKVNDLSSHFQTLFKIRFNIILPFRVICPKCSLPSRLFDKNFACNSDFMRATRFTHLALHYLIAITTCGEEKFYETPHCPIFASLKLLPLS
jgi:hypothetical protein